MNTNSLPWHTPPTDLSLPPNEVHIWRVDLEASPAVIERCATILSPSERARAERYVFERHRRRWTVARAALRLLLGRYLDVELGAIEFDFNKFGKPSLAGSYEEGKIEFNLSHSAEMALYAFTRDRLVGVDVEYMRDDLDYDGMARQSFSLQEQDILRKLVGEEKRQAFFRGWTCKEAYAKALGKGFSQAFDHFTVSLLPSQPYALLQQADDDRELTRWSFVALDAGPDYAGALVVEGHECQPRCWLYVV
jgi:4'-phosphopantetheinyl transferase